MKTTQRDSNAKIRFAAIMTAIAVSAFVLFGTGRKPAKIEDGVEEAKEKTAIETSQAVPVSIPETITDLASPAPRALEPAPTESVPTFLGPATKEEIRSLDTLATILFEQASGTTRPAQLIDELARLGYQPVVARDVNEVTGAMVIVRTKNALPGTRYFHAQFFTDENGKYYPQHVSFEFRPSQSMDDVVRSLESRFGRLGRPTTNDGIWMTWKLPNDYSLWIKRIERSDIEDGSRFNAYAAEDLNTLRVALEKDVPGHEDDEPHL